MSLYNKQDFENDLNQYFSWNMDKIKQLEKDLSEIKHDVKCSWRRFDGKVDAVVKGYLPEQEVSGMVPDYQNAHTMTQICQCLDAVRGNHIENSMKAYLYQSLSEEEQKNYFARIYYMKWANNRTRQEDWEVFVLMCAEVKLLHALTKKMLNWLILTHGNKVVGNGTWSVSKSLQNVLSGDSINYESPNHSTLLRIVYSLRLIPVKQIRYTPEQLAENSEVTKKLMINLFRDEGYDAHSILDMIYFYGTVRNLTYEEIHEMTILAAQQVFRQLLPDTVKDKKIEDYVKKYDKTPRQSAETLLNFSNYRGESGFLMQVCQFAKAKITWDTLRDFLKVKLEQMHIKSGHIINDGMDTDVFFDHTAQNYVLRCQNKEDYVKKICSDNDFYIDILGKHASVSRSNAVFGVGCSDEEKAAKQIYWDDKFSDVLFNDIGKLGNLQWKTRAKKATGIEQKKAILKEYFDTRLDYLETADLSQKRRSKWEEIHNFGILDREAFYQALLDEIQRDETGAVTREYYLYSQFQICIEEQSSSEDFKQQLSDEEDMTGLRWHGFDDLNYYDIYLYMCLNTSHPMETFNELNATEDYHYWNKD